ncbi:MAG: hypothetical protein USCAAHI_00087 [Beijerinckiaceae bacterium]|nr:MAG: hypothetical protein USCAAHI_00087 [Beijerinckiaceae bacterium]
MPDTYDDIARRAAQRLSGDLGQDLPAAVEAELQAGGKGPERYEPGTLIALATLLLNVAKFAWDIYRDRTKDTKAAPSAETIARTIRLEPKSFEGVSTEQRDKIINVVVEELLMKPPKA